MSPIFTSYFNRKHHVNVHKTFYEYDAAVRIQKRFICLNSNKFFLFHCSTGAVSPASGPRLYSCISQKGTCHAPLFFLCTGSQSYWFWQNKHSDVSFFPPFKCGEVIQDFLFLGLAGSFWLGHFLILLADLLGVTVRWCCSHLRRVRLTWERAPVSTR